MIYHGQRRTLNDLQATVTRAVKELRPHRSKFDSIVVTGMSGVLVGIPVALALKVPVVVLRKEQDKTHQGRGTFVNGADLGRRVLFLDDFGDSGATERRVTDRVEQGEFGDIIRPRIVGRYFYGYDSGYEAGLEWYPSGSWASTPGTAPWNYARVENWGGASVTISNVVQEYPDEIPF